MTSLKCPYCGSKRLTRSPSGKHLLCVECNRVQMQHYTRKPRGRKAALQHSAAAPNPSRS